MRQAVSTDKEEEVVQAAQADGREGSGERDWVGDSIVSSIPESDQAVVLEAF